MSQLSIFHEQNHEQIFFSCTRIYNHDSMASLQKRSKIYYIVFNKRINGKDFQKKFSLGTSKKKLAERKRLEYEQLFSEGTIDPFGGWSPKTHEKGTQITTNQTHKITLSDLADVFIRTRSQANDTTKNNYRRHLNLFIKQVGGTMPVTMLTESDIREFCFKPGLKTATHASYLRHMKVFTGWLFENKHIKKDIAKNIKKPRVPNNFSDKTITEFQLREIFFKYRKDIYDKKKARQIVTKAQSRVWFRPVVSVAFYGGLRVKEIVNLRWQQVNFPKKLIIVSNTKSGIERVVPMRTQLYDILKAWYRYQNKPRSGLVFPSEKNHAKQIKLSKHNISRVFKFYVKETLKNNDVNFHGLRHSCGTNLLRLGFDINEVAKILGHSSLEVTRIYEHLTSKDLTDKMLLIEGESSEHEKEKQKLRDENKKLKAKIRELNKNEEKR